MLFLLRTSSKTHERERQRVSTARLWVGPRRCTCADRPPPASSHSEPLPARWGRGLGTAGGLDPTHLRGLTARLLPRERACTRKDAAARAGRPGARAGTSTRARSSPHARTRARSPVGPAPCTAPRPLFPVRAHPRGAGSARSPLLRQVLSAPRTRRGSLPASARLPETLWGPHWGRVARICVCPSRPHQRFQPPDGRAEERPSPERVVSAPALR